MQNEYVSRLESAVSRAHVALSTLTTENSKLKLKIEELECQLHALQNVKSRKRKQDELIDKTLVLSKIQETNSEMSKEIVMPISKVQVNFANTGPSADVNGKVSSADFKSSISVAKYDSINKSHSRSSFISVSGKPLIVEPTKIEDIKEALDDLFSDSESINTNNDVAKVEIEELPNKPSKASLISSILVGSTDMNKVIENSNNMDPNESIQDYMQSTSDDDDDDDDDDTRNECDYMENDVVDGIGHGINSNSSSGNMLSHQPVFIKYTSFIRMITSTTNLEDISENSSINNNTHYSRFNRGNIQHAADLLYNESSLLLVSKYILKYITKSNNYSCDTSDITEELIVHDTNSTLGTKLDDCILSLSVKQSCQELIEIFNSVIMRKKCTIHTIAKPSIYSNVRCSGYNFINDILLVLLERRVLASLRKKSPFFLGKLMGVINSDLSINTIMEDELENFNKEKDSFIVQETEMDECINKTIELGEDEMNSKEENSLSMGHMTQVSKRRRRRRSRRSMQEYREYSRKY